MLLAGTGCSAAAPGPAFAQVWLAPKGEASFSVVYSNVYIHDHLFSAGQPLDLGHIHSDNVLMDTSFAFTDRLNLGLAVPYMAAWYNGIRPHQLPIDDGSNRWTFQDFRLEARYNATGSPVVLTPFVAVILPSHHYEYFGHSAIGRDLHELRLGTGFGRRLNPFLPDVVVQGRVSYAFVEKVDGISHNQSNLDLEVAYFATPSFRISAIASAQKTHGGIEFISLADAATWSATQWHHHDQASRADILDVGGGVGFSATPALDVFASWITTVAGKNVHAIKSGLIVGVTWGFSPAQIVRRMTHRAAPAADAGH